MKKAFMLLMASLVLTTGCIGYVAPVMPPVGLIFESVSAPLDTDMQQTQASPKEGEASSICVLWLFAFGDCSIQKAARDGNITTINYADYSYLNILGFFQSFTVHVYGE
ncbi:MAG: hypothetical protein Kow0059_08190 [Candidatus Sumerlaeia bacterium]